MLLKKFFNLGLISTLALLPLGMDGRSAQAAFFETINGRGLFTEVYGISADASTVIGFDTLLFYDGKIIGDPFFWTQDEGWVEFYRGPGLTQPFGVSADGSVIVGVNYDDNSIFSPGEAFLWTNTGGLVGLGHLTGTNYYSSANAVSANGSVVVGVSGNGYEYEAFLWTESGGMVGLGDLPGGDYFSSADGVSADGSVVVGTSASIYGREAFLWTESGGMVGLGNLLGGNYDSSANAVSADGSVVVGESDSVYGREAFLWTESGGMVGLGDLPGGLFFSVATGVSADGSVIVGYSTSTHGNEAFIWDSTNGMRSLQDVLTNNFGLDLMGWQLTSAVGVSADGLTIVGNGYPNSPSSLWIANLSSNSTKIPEPYSLFALSLICLLGMVSKSQKTDI